MAYTHLKPLNDYVFKPLYRRARKSGLSQEASIRVSHIPGAFLETGGFWFIDWRLGLGLFLIDEAIMPRLLYRHHMGRRQPKNLESSVSGEQLTE